jgi:Tfp pilus assembly protein PilF
MLTALHKPPLAANDLYPKSSARIIAFVPTRASHERMLLVAVTFVMIAAGFMMGLALYNVPKDGLAAGINYMAHMVMPVAPVMKPVEIAVTPAPAMPPAIPVPVASVPVTTAPAPQSPAPSVPPLEASQLIARNVMETPAPMSVPAPEVEAVTPDAAPVIVAQNPAPFDIMLAGDPVSDFGVAAAAPVETFERLIKRAQNALTSGDNETALALYKIVLDADADNAAALTGVAYIYQASGSYDQAADAERRLLAIDPADIGARTGLALALGHATTPTVRKELEALAEANPASAPMQVALARYLAHHEDVRGAFDHLARAIELEPGNLSYRLDLAVLYDRAGQTGQALSLYRQVLEAAPGGLAHVSWSENAPQAQLPLNAIRARMAYLAERDGG